MSIPDFLLSAVDTSPTTPIPIGTVHGQTELDKRPAINETPKARKLLLAKMEAEFDKY